MINLFNTPSNILNFFLYFVTVFNAGKFGIKGSTLLGLIIIMLGGVLNFFLETNYYYSVIGCTLQYVGVSVICCLFGEVAYRWFDDGERPLALAIMFVLKEVSMSFNLIIPGLMIKEEMSNKQIIDGVLY